MPCNYKYNVFMHILFLVLLWPLPASSQTCFGGRPLPRCSGFVVLESSSGVRLKEKSGPTDKADAFLWWGLGYLKNIDPKQALGGSVKLTADSDGHRYGPILRYRRWLESSWGVDLGTGSYIGGKDNFVMLVFPSPTFEVGLTYADWFAVQLGMDVLRRKGMDTSLEPYIGIRLGRWLAPLGTLGLGVLIGATY